MSDKEEKFKEVCDYFKREIMGYDENQMLTKKMILRLRGLSTGQYMANKSQEAMANYPYEVILLTLKYIKPRLQGLIGGKNFKDEQHKFNYLMVIISNNINLVYNKVKKIKEEKQKIETITADSLPNYENKYENRNSKLKSENMEEFW